MEVIKRGTISPTGSSTDTTSNLRGSVFYFRRDYMELINIGEVIYNKVKELEKLREELSNINKAAAITEYEKTLATRIMMLSNSKAYMWQGKQYTKPAATLTEKIAKGMIAEETGYKKELAESEYKSKIVQIESLKAEINALQSVNKYNSDI